MTTNAIALGAVCPWPQALRHLRPRAGGKQHNRIRVKVRSFTDKGMALSQRRVLRFIGESEARLMCGEDSFGNTLEGVEACARRLSAKKAPLTDIELLAPERQPRHVKATLTFSDSVNNGFAKAFRELGGPEISIYALDTAEAKVAAWPEVHDDKAVVISARKVYGATHMGTIPEPIVSFA